MRNWWVGGSIVANFYYFCVAQSQLEKVIKIHCISLWLSTLIFRLVIEDDNITTLFKFVGALQHARCSCLICLSFISPISSYNSVLKLVDLVLFCLFISFVLITCFEHPSPPSSCQRRRKSFFFSFIKLFCDAPLIFMW